MAKYQVPDDVGLVEADPNDKRMLRVTIEAINEDGTTEELWQAEEPGVCCMLMHNDEKRVYTRCAMLNVTDQMLYGAIMGNDELKSVREAIGAAILIDHLGEIAMGDHVEGVKH